MKIKIYITIFLAVMALGCTKNTVTDANDVDFPNETKGVSLPTEAHKKNEPMAQQKLSSILGDLADASVPEKFAKEHGISLLNNKVRVFIYFTPDTSSSEKKKVLKAHDIQVEKESHDLARAWVPVNRLILLSKEPIIQLIRLPKTLIKTNGKSDE